MNETNLGRPTEAIQGYSLNRGKKQGNAGKVTMNAGASNSEPESYRLSNWQTRQELSGRDSGLGAIQACLYVLSRLLQKILVQPNNLWEQQLCLIVLDDVIGNLKPGFVA